MSLRELALRQTAHELDIRGATENAEEKEEHSLLHLCQKRKSGIAF